MDVWRNIKDMSANQFCSLMAFEVVYLLVLAVLPFIVAFREITYIVLGIFLMAILMAVFKHLMRRPIDPAGRIILITGCDSGFGNACARQLDANGFTVVAGCHDDESDGAKRLKESTSGHLHVVKLDITDEESVNRCVSKVSRMAGDKGLWALINNAGIAGFGDFEFTSLESYCKVMDVNMFGTLRITKACLPLIRTAKGRVITMSGATGQLSLPGQSAFCMSSFGLEAFSDALRLELQPFGVKVITVRPGNYAGATGLLNRASLEKLQSVFDDMKKNTDPKIVAAYGRDYLDLRYSQLSELSKSTAGSLVNVMDAMEDAVLNKGPKSQYLIDGGNQLFDLGNTLIRLKPFLPCAMHDFLVSRYYGSKISSTKRKA